MIEVTNKNELETQLKENKRVLALFYSSWCPFCRRFLPAFDKNSSKSGFNLAICVKVDDDDNPLWEEYSVEAVPTVIFFEEGKIRRRLNGRFGYGLSEKQLEEWLDEKK
ncbi:thioredoxin family protein [Candidatus Bathyarchaeota archaeon]|nr:thioredoxin family protein [Candidatus Bathyarchaeota archaeon]